jgi:hypothetical protein
MNAFNKGAMVASLWLPVVSRDECEGDREHGKGDASIGIVDLQKLS